MNFHQQSDRIPSHQTLAQTKELVHFSILTTFGHLKKSLGFVRRFETVLAKVIWRNAAKLSYFGKTSAKTPFPGHQIPSPADNHPSKVPEVSVPVIRQPCGAGLQMLDFDDFSGFQPKVSGS